MEKCKLPHGHVIDPYFVLEMSTWIIVFAITEDGNVVLVEQYRHGTEKMSLEIPAGIMEKSDKDPLEAVKRELLEETGYASEEIEQIGVLAPNPAIQNNYQYCFLAKNAKKVAEQDLDDGEHLEVVLKSIEKVLELIENGTIDHSLHVPVIYMALRKLGKI